MSQGRLQRELTEGDVNGFLAHLALKENVAASAGWACTGAASMSLRSSTRR